MKEKGLHVMFELSDVKCLSQKDGRDEQKAWAHFQGKKELISMWLVTYIASQGYDYSELLKARANEGRQMDRELLGARHPGEAQPPLEAHQVQVELQCVYREMALRYGPFFVWASVLGSKPQQRWVLERIEHGLKQLKLYEETLSPKEDSLHAVVFGTILEKTKGQRRSNWLDEMDLT